MTKTAVQAAPAAGSPDIKPSILEKVFYALGQTARRDAALKQASQRYAANPPVLSQLKAAAAAPIAGVAP